MYYVGVVVLGNPQPTLRPRASAENALHQQQVPNSPAKIHERKIRTLPTRSTPPAQKKLSGMCNPDIQNHFIAGLASVNKNFPVHLWCRLLPHFLLTLNLLRPSQINPKLSAYAQLHDAFDFNRTLLAPPGTKIIIHDKPAIRESWATRGHEGYYIGPTSNHYCCHTVYTNHTAHE